MPIGNDLIDLGRSENLARGTNSRLHQRVLSESERSLLASRVGDAAGDGPELTYLKLWSAKEAAFKLLKQSDNDLLFSHSRFEVTPFSQESGQVNFSGIVVPVIWQTTEHWLHCIALDPCEANRPHRTNQAVRVERTADWLLQDPFTEAEEVSIYSEASRAVRHLVKAMARTTCASRGATLNLKGLELLRFPAGKRYSPPRLYLEGELLEHLELSLSHDGEYVAAVLCGC